jgi:hypothetical protein
MIKMTPKGREKTIWDVLTSVEGGTTEEHLKLYEDNAVLYKSAIMFLIIKRAPVRRFLIPKALALAYSKYDIEFVKRLHKDATALDVRDAVRLVKGKTYGVSLTGGRNKNRQDLVRQYLRNKTPEELQWQLLTGGRVLTEIADLSHPHPRDWAGEEWIAKTAYGEAPKKDSLIEAARRFRTLVREDIKNIADQEYILDNYNLPWHYVRESYGTADIPNAVKKLLIKSFSLRGLIKELGTFKGFDAELVNALSKDGRYLSFSVPFGAYLNSQPQTTSYWGAEGTLDIPISVRLALLTLASKQFEKLYFSESLGPVAIGMDVSGSMDKCIEVASTIAAMISSKMDNVSMYSFGPELVEFKKLPRNLSDVMVLISKVKARGATNISDFFLQKKVMEAKTVILVSDGGENRTSNIRGHAGKNVKDVLQYQNPNQRIFYLRMENTWGADPLMDTFKTSELWWRSTEIKDVSQLDQIIPMLSYDDYHGIEDDLVSIAGAFVPPIDFYNNICAACGDPVEEPVNIGCEHVFHVACLERFWNLLETNYKVCPYGCKPVHRCANCNGPASVDADDCPHCGYIFAKHE